MLELPKFYISTSSASVQCVRFDPHLSLSILPTVTNKRQEIIDSLPFELL